MRAVVRREPQRAPEIRAPAAIPTIAAAVQLYECRELSNCSTQCVYRGIASSSSLSAPDSARGPRPTARLAAVRWPPRAYSYYIYFIYICNMLYMKRDVQAAQRSTQRFDARRSNIARELCYVAAEEDLPCRRELDSIDLSCGRGTNYAAAAIDRQARLATLLLLPRSDDRSSLRLGSDIRRSLARDIATIAVVQDKNKRKHSVDNYSGGTRYVLLVLYMRKWRCSTPSNATRARVECTVIVARLCSLASAATSTNYYTQKRLYTGPIRILELLAQCGMQLGCIYSRELRPIAYGMRRWRCRRHCYIGTRIDASANGHSRGVHIYTLQCRRDFNGSKSEDIARDREHINYTQLADCSSHSRTLYTAYVFLYESVHSLFFHPRARNKSAILVFSRTTSRGVPTHCTYIAAVDARRRRAPGECEKVPLARANRAAKSAISYTARDSYYTTRGSRPTTLARWLEIVAQLEDHSGASKAKILVSRGVIQLKRGSGNILRASQRALDEDESCGACGLVQRRGRGIHSARRGTYASPTPTPPPRRGARAGGKRTELRAVVRACALSLSRSIFLCSHAHSLFRRRRHRDSRRMLLMLLLHRCVF
ncbi:unnamed protein product [Trichogramma brassicae]|uniref:Uncharacterized protein n=1 Tax=Trichogramma brassicae TaxID=86971 RepID=A0A6H5HVQ8_9HYME|nr:unnamed protein product [Trichogramma brassicae]